MKSGTTGQGGKTDPFQIPLMGLNAQQLSVKALQAIHKAVMAHKDHAYAKLTGGQKPPEKSNPMAQGAR